MLRNPKHAKGSYTLEGCSGKAKFKTGWTLGAERLAALRGDRVP